MKKVFRLLSAIMLCLCLAISMAACSFLDELFGGDTDSGDKGTTTGTNDYNVETIKNASMSLHLVALGRDPGDCIYIQVGDVKVLIDAGAKKSDASIIKTYLNQYVTDGYIDYLIATHPHEDHIAALIGNKSGTSFNGILSTYSFGTIIDFGTTEQSSTQYEDYCDLVDAQVVEGAKHYTDIECYNGTNGAQKVWNLGNGVTMTILYNYYNTISCSNLNNESVCVLLNDGTNNYLLTGDLEEEGEEKLVENNDLPECLFFKAGHHGSETATNDCLLEVIKPKIVGFTACAGNTTAYKWADPATMSFPSQAVITRVSKYATQAYCTNIVTDNGDGDTDTTDGFTALNGSIVLTSSNGTVNVTCSNNNTNFIETDWFKANRTWG